MKKTDLATRLEQLENWAKELRKQVRDDPNFKQLQDQQEAPADATFFALMRAAAEDTRFVEYATLAGVAAAAPAMVRAEVAAEKPEPIGFREFLRNISESVVSTQEKLDDESARYLQKIKDQRHIHPSVFRLPKVSAQMKFALEIDKEKKLNFLFFSNKDKNVSRNEQGIDFDIVTIPAPPDALQATAALAPTMDLLLDPFKRQTLLDIVKGFSPATLLNPLIQGAKETPRRLIILEMTRATPQTYLLFHATKESDNAVGLWKLVTSPQAPPVLSTLYRFNRANGTEEKEVRDLILQLANEQEKFLQ